MAFEISGKLIEKYDEVAVSNTFRKREFVIEKSENNGGRVFTDQIKFQLTQDKCSILDDFKFEEEINVHFNIRGRKWEKDGRVNYFTNLEAWRIEKAGSTTNDAFENVPPPLDDFTTLDNDTDDLPF